MVHGSADEASTIYRDEFLRGTSRWFTPLVGAVAGGNSMLVKSVLDSLLEPRLNRREV